MNDGDNEPTAQNLIEDARGVALELLRAAGYSDVDAETFSTVGQLNGTVPNAERPRDPRIKGSAGGWEAFWAVAVLYYCREYEQAREAKDWDGAARHAYMVGAAKDRMQIKQFWAQYQRAGGKTRVQQRNSKATSFVQTAAALYPELKASLKCEPTIEALLYATQERTGTTVAYSTFAKQWRQLCRDKFSQ